MRSRLVALLLGLLLLATACAGDKPSGTPGRSPAPTEQGVVVAIAGDNKGVSLYRVGTDRRARQLRTITPPAGADVLGQISLSAGSSPDLCVAWRRTVDPYGGSEPVAVWCYPGEGGTGHAVTQAGKGTTLVALSPDASRLAWFTTQSTAEYSEEELVIAAYQSGQVSEVRRFRHLTKEGFSEEVETGCAQNGLAGLAWAGPGLLLECPGSNDDPGLMLVRRADLTDKPRTLPDGNAAPYTYVTRVGGADARSAYVVQGEYCEIACPDKQPPASDRAVRVDLKSGKVLEVIATADSGRGMVSVSGGPRGVVYVTQGSSGQRVFLRLPGEKRGTRITGLPAGDVFAQP